MIEAVLSVSGMALAAGVGLGIAAKKFYVGGDPITDKVTEALPATNCGGCGFPGCRAYAEAMVKKDVAEINLCTPGGVDVMMVVAEILGVEPMSMESDGPRIAYIYEDRCIGCTACIKACPVDAIIGANKQSHTVIADWCTSCGACVEPCPVDCIEMVLVEQTLYTWAWEKPEGPRRVN